MRITVTRTGGFAGVHQQLGPVETSALAPGLAEQVGRILTEVDFFTLPASLQGAPVRDGFRYTVHAEGGTLKHTVTMQGHSDDMAVISLHQLVDVLHQAAGFEDVPLSSTLPDGVVLTRDWTAWYNRMPGSHDPDLHVSGICGLASSHTTVRLEPGNVGTVPEPDLCVLQLVVTRPDFDDDLYLECEVSWHDDVGPDIKRVRINGVSPEITVGIVC
jgi:hypothetical protein